MRRQAPHRLLDGVRIARQKLGGMLLEPRHELLPVDDGALGDSASPLRHSDSGSDVTNVGVGDHKCRLA